MYSRITGYYRPVQNWNEGKTQEYKNRTTYDIGRSVLKHQGPLMRAGSQCTVDAAALAKKQEETAAADSRGKVKLYLFTTQTCPNCRTAKEFLKGMDYQIVDAAEHPDLAERFGIMQAPTLVVVQDGIVRKFANASNIRKFAEQNSAAARA